MLGIEFIVSYIHTTSLLLGLFAGALMSETVKKVGRKIAERYTGE